MPGEISVERIDERNFYICRLCDEKRQFSSARTIVYHFRHCHKFSVVKLEAKPSTNSLNFKIRPIPSTRSIHSNAQIPLTMDSVVNIENLRDRLKHLTPDHLRMLTELLKESPTVTPKIKRKLPVKSTQYRRRRYQPGKKYKPKNRVPSMSTVDDVPAGDGGSPTPSSSAVSGDCSATVSVLPAAHASSTSSTTAEAVSSNIPQKQMSSDVPDDVSDISSPPSLLDFPTGSDIQHLFEGGEASVNNILLDVAAAAGDAATSDETAVWAISDATLDDGISTGVMPGTWTRCDGTGRRRGDSLSDGVMGVPGGSNGLPGRVWPSVACVQHSPSSSGKTLAENLAATPLPPMISSLAVKYANSTPILSSLPSMPYAPSTVDGWNAVHMRIMDVLEALPLPWGMADAFPHVTRMLPDVDVASLWRALHCVMNISRRSAQVAFITQCDSGRNDGLSLLRQPFI